MAEIVEAGSPADVETVRALFQEYKKAVGVDLWFGGFERELADLPRPYVRPGGRLLLLRQGRRWRAAERSGRWRPASRR